MIDDFGAVISGAAKHKWAEFAQRMKQIPDERIGAEPLSKVFPEPRYDQLIEEGVDARVVALVRVLRDMIPHKGRHSHTVGRWVSITRASRSIAAALLVGDISVEDALSRLSASDGMRLNMETYVRVGHAGSLKDIAFSRRSYRETVGGPQTLKWGIESRKRNIRIREEKIEDAIDALVAALSDAAPASKARSGPRLEIRRFGSTDIRITRKIGTRYIALATFETVSDARKHLAEHYEALLERFENLRKVADLRTSENRPRKGALRLHEAVTPELFSTTFGFRGVQFGNYVTGPQRQEMLDQAYVALLDLADILSVSPRTLSLGGRLALAFGARGSGGIHAANAHYEPVQVVINLTKTRGAGSLAHEWFHALDNHLARSDSLVDVYTTSSPARGREPYSKASALLRDLRDALHAKTEIAPRSGVLDRYRAKDYFSIDHEITARSFEAWVIHRLGQKGIINDFLANIVSEEVFAAEAALFGQEDARYPYPLRSEVEAVDAAFGRAFAENGALVEALEALGSVDIE